MYFVNFSNHPSKNWDTKQREAAEKWGTIVDYPFPQVCVQASKPEIEDLAVKITEEILELHPSAVMCQGEFTLAFHVITRLKARKIPVVSACSIRRAAEQPQPDGTIRKISFFEFAGFREY